MSSSFCLAMSSIESGGPGKSLDADMAAYRVLLTSVLGQHGTAALRGSVFTSQKTVQPHPVHFLSVVATPKLPITVRMVAELIDVTEHTMAVLGTDGVGFALLHRRCLRSSRSGPDADTHRLIVDGLCHSHTPTLIFYSPYPCLNWCSYFLQALA